MAWTEGRKAAAAVTVIIVLCAGVTAWINSGAFETRSQQIYTNGVNNAHNLPNRLYTYPDGDVRTREYLLELFKRFKVDVDPARDLKSDRELTEQDILTRTIYIYGSPENHSFFGRIRSRLPLIFEKDGVVVGKKKCIGRDVGAVFVCPNPLNTSLVMVIYGAVSPEAVQNMNGVHHGPTDYVVFNDKTRQFTGAQPSDCLLLKGSFDKSDTARWRVDEELQLQPTEELRKVTADVVVAQ